MLDGSGMREVFSIVVSQLGRTWMGSVIRLIVARIQQNEKFAAYVRGAWYMPCRHKGA